ncbi:MAG TPA: hypothetical protein PL059_04010 [Spirochaetota bacterium]|nr:hypothetical protein [Spirochaetota bacterium]HOM10396.1 hypothetical protein [Spirochaetota bacterium]HPP50233.1 hypothetical protein [Spirochaetota bacterium]
MNPHITTIHFDATTFSIDDRLVHLLQAKTHYNELSPNKIHDTFLNHTFFHGGDNSDTSQVQQTNLSKGLLHMLSQTRQKAQPEVFYCKVETHHYNPLQTCIVDEYPMYPFMLTLGQQFEHWCHEHALVSEQYYAHLAGMWMLQHCVESLAQILAMDRYCTVYPGSSKDVPLQVNRQLYMVFSKEARSSGITLNEQYMFWPLHTIAGIILPHTGENTCQSCTLLHCQFRNILT